MRNAARIRSYRFDRLHCQLLPMLSGILEIDERRYRAFGGTGMLLEEKFECIKNI